MIPYRDLGRDSGVEAYECGDDYITVQFKSGGVYKYTYRKPGRSEVEHMKALARAGNGLNTYINTSVGDRHERRIR